MAASRTPQTHGRNVPRPQGEVRDPEDEDDGDDEDDEEDEDERTSKILCLALTENDQRIVAPVHFLVCRGDRPGSQPRTLASAARSPAAPRRPCGVYKRACYQRASLHLAGKT